MFGQIGTGSGALSYSSPAPVNFAHAQLPISSLVDNTVAISTSDEHTVAITSDGNLWGWDNAAIDGVREVGASPEQIMSDVTMVATGSGHTMAVTFNGELWAWGNNTHGQLGDGTNIDRQDPVLIMNDVSGVFANESYTVIMKTDGSVWAWGLNPDLQLGGGIAIDSNVPVVIFGGVDVTSVIAHYNHVMVIESYASSPFHVIQNETIIANISSFEFTASEPIPYLLLYDQMSE